MDVVYLDYRKAFDSVPHQRLLEKLKGLGIKGKLLQWLERTDYYMTGGLSGKTKLESVQEERDLGVLIRSELKSVSQCNKSAATARRVIGMVRRNFKHLDIDDFQIIYKTYIRSHLEYCIQAWSPHLVKDIDVLENVQKAATNLVQKLRKSS